MVGSTSYGYNVGIGVSNLDVSDKVADLPAENQTQLV